VGDTGCTRKEIDFEAKFSLRAFFFARCSARLFWSPRLIRIGSGLVHTRNVGSKSLGIFIGRARDPHNKGFYSAFPRETSGIIYQHHFYRWIGGLMTVPFNSIYDATKWALKAWSESMAA
jgi:hypothetical protein